MYGYFLRMNEATLFNMKRTSVLSEISRASHRNWALSPNACSRTSPLVITNAKTHADHSAGTDDRSAFLSKRRVSEGNALAPSNIFR